MPFPEIDWNEAWKRDQAIRRSPDDSSYWDKRAPTFRQTAGTSPYVQTFIEWAGIEDGETIFDMGCGSGTLALPLATAGHEVHAADFSPAMIELMLEQAREEGIADRIHSTRLAWGDDWSDVDIPVCDVAIASRSIATDDLGAALTKLMSKARRRVCVTLAEGSSPRCDDVLMRAMGRMREYAPDYVYCMNILWSRGFRPELRFIASERSSTFESFEAAIEKTCDIFHATPEERRRLVDYSEKHLHEVDDEAGSHWEYDHTRVTSWAFISWDLN